MNYLGDFSEDETVYVFYTTNDGNGGRVSFSAALETADFEVIKDGNATGSVAGITLDEDFDSRTGVHKVTIDLSSDAFYSTGSDYALLLYPDETVDSQSIAAVVASWSIENRHTAAGSSPPSAADIADAVWDEAATGHIDAGKAGAQLWTDIDAILTDTNELQSDDVPGLISALDTVVDRVETDTQDIQSRLPAALVSGRMSSDAVAISGSTSAADSVESNISNLDATISSRGTADPGDQMALINDAITSAKYDESTAFPQTGDSFARIGATGSGLTTLATQASVNTIDGIVDAILDDTDSTIPTQLSSMAGAGFVTGTDSLEALRNRGDSAWITATGFAPANEYDTEMARITANVATASALATADGKIDNILTDTGTTIPGLVSDLDTVIDRIEADTQDLQTQIGTDGAGLTNLPAVTLANGAHGGAAASITLADYSDFTGAAASNPNVLQSGTITVTNQTTFVLNAGSADDDAYNNMVVVLEDSATATQKSVRTITDYTGSTRTVIIDSAPDFTIANTDSFNILAVAPGSTPPTVGQIRAEIDSNSTQLAAIVEDTGVTIPGTISTMQGNVTSILEDTGTTLDTLVKDIPTNTELAAAFTEIKGDTWSDTTDTLEHIRNKQTDIETDTAEIGVAGAGLTNINLPNQTMDITGNISGSVGSVTDGVTLADNAITSAKYDESTAFPLTAVNGSTLTEAGGTGDQFTGIPKTGYSLAADQSAVTIGTVTNLTNAPTSGDLTATMKASINTEVDTALNTSTISSPTAGSIADYVMRTKYVICNKFTIDSSDGKSVVHNDSEVAVSTIPGAFTEASTIKTRLKVY